MLIRLLRLCMVFPIFFTACNSNTLKDRGNPKTQRLPESNQGSRRDDAPKYSEMAQRLIDKQNAHFPNILKELQDNKRKTSHWIWWVFPTERSGASEPDPKTSVDLSTVDDLLKNANMDAWSQILEEIFALLKNAASVAGVWQESGNNKPDENVIPSIDHGRIQYALEFWLGKAKEHTQKNARFFNALDNLKRFDWTT
jgi:hypothetical protein